MRAFRFFTLSGALAGALAAVMAPVGHAAPQPTVTFSVQPDGDIVYKVTYFRDNSANKVEVRDISGPWSLTVPVADPNTTGLIAMIQDPSNEAEAVARVFMHCTITSNTGETIDQEDGPRPSAVQCAGPKSYLAHMRG
jgi:hypothetical protein